MQASEITPYHPADHAAIRLILHQIGWEEPYIVAFERTAEQFAARDDAAVWLAKQSTRSVGFIFVQQHTWNQLAQIQGLAVAPSSQRHGVASALVAQAERFALDRHARGIYVDTPTTNTGGRRLYAALGYAVGYIMPRYYAADLDGVTYQKFFDNGR